MYTENHDVENKEANGTLCHLQKIVLYDDVTDEDFEIVNMDGYFVRCLGISNVKFLLCTLDEDCPISNRRTLKIRPDNVTCRISMPLSLIPGEEHKQTVRARLNRFPVLVNHATTGHKLQGQTKDDGVFIKEWHYKKNWPYVVLSRVTTLAGLFLQKPIDATKNYTKDSRLLNMLSQFKKRTPANNTLVYTGQKHVREEDESR